MPLHSQSLMHPRLSFLHLMLVLRCSLIRGGAFSSNTSTFFLFCPAHLRLSQDGEMRMGHPTHPLHGRRHSAALLSWQQQQSPSPAWAHNAQARRSQTHTRTRNESTTLTKLTWFSPWSSYICRELNLTWDIFNTPSKIHFRIVHTSSIGFMKQKPLKNTPFKYILFLKSVGIKVLF